MNERMKTCYKKQYQAETLQEAFEKFGHIEDCHIAKHPDGKSKGFGFVRYSDPRDAEDAMDRMNQKEFEGRLIRIDIATERHQRDVKGA